MSAEVFMELPVACSLSPEALAARREGLLAELLQLAVSREGRAEGIRLTFAASDDVLTRIAITINAERHCCQFLRFQVTVEPAAGPVILDLTGPSGTREFLAALIDADPTNLTTGPGKPEPSSQRAT